MAYNYSKLLGRIKEKYGTQDRFATVLGIGRVSLSQRLNSKLDFSQDEINRSIDILGLSKNEIPVYFFEEKV